MTPEHRPDARELDSAAARHALYAARLGHVRATLARHDVAALLVCDPNHIRYITGAVNMQVWGMRSPSRYLLVIAEGPVILFDGMSFAHLAADLPTIDDIRPAEGLDFLSSGGAVDAAAERFAVQITRAVHDCDPAIDRIHVDRIPWQAVDRLRARGMDVADALAPLCMTRALKLDIELPYIREAMTRVEAGVARLERRAEPGLSEAETWAEFHYDLMARQGQYVSTRLFQSGPNTFPYFQETGRRALCEGDLLCLDTDALGYENYAVDFSRTFLCGDRRPTDDQRLLYARAREQLEHNAALLLPHTEFRALAEKAWRIPQEHLESRYYCFGHGLGMAGEWPNIPHHDASDGDYPLEGMLLPGMIICIESYIGWARSHEGVKLEDQFLITETGAERMSTYPYDDRLTGRMM